MKAIRAEPERWEVLSASHNPEKSKSIYLVAHSGSKTGVKVSVSNSGKHTYAYGNYARAKERVSDEVRIEIDKALVRFLSVKK